jgi:alpha-glucosidase
VVTAEVAHIQWVVRAPGGAAKATLRTAAGDLEMRVAATGMTVVLGPAPRRGTPHRGRWSARFTTPAGKRRVHRLTGRTLTLGRVKVLATRDGIAFRAPHAVYVPPRHTRSWLQPYTGVYEEPYRTGHGDGRYGFPALLRSRGRYALLTESGVGRGAAAHLRRVARRLSVDPHDGLWQVVLTGPLRRIVASDLPLALGRPSRIHDTSWIEPGRAAWSWWADRGSTSEAEQRRYVDLAAAQGWEYVTVDNGWNPAWIADLIAYARERGVRVILWYAADSLSLDQARAYGAAGVKVDYFQSDRAHRIAQMDTIAREAAARHMVVDFHGCTIPRGLQRTWPNVLSLEAVRGAEHSDRNPRDAVNLAFTRNVVGSMDFTPVAVGAHLGESVVYESGLQHFAGTPAGYASDPAAEAFLRDVPAAWDDTRLLGGRPDDFVVIARRAGARWFVGALSAGPARTLSVPLPAGRFLAHVVGDDGPYDVTVSGRLSVRVAADGGYAAELTPSG